MARVVFTANLRQATGGLSEAEIAGGTVADVIRALDERMPGIRHYLVDDAGALRRHVNVFVDGARVRDRERLGDAVAQGSTVHIMQALSGG